MSVTSSYQQRASPTGFGAFLHSCWCALFSSSLPSDPENSNSNSTAPMPEKKYVHVPQNAASGFLRTATSRQMRKDNEILA
ncbi:hypothetical protein PG993_006004 [Apiospora rasikravindrae]|uniref:Secreted protein n=1 Tax=Apiospora rasikravindrae TaxID=990691 RepID=A0ABR1TAD2_9PEZI